ncbi:hypothetical protein [Magnetospirillum sp. SS-4]|uniref:DUF6901 family protein n=1 Tax=Magnetospirillum sp. SS-4 TaxID=2681465 RepID=UPI00137CAEF5|nr:hypothetical protein [Magnetospirillum sp. SS-4]CAA7613730.1 conserved hypothetical protein [Magnetospirillum sp. SS-4]
MNADITTILYRFHLPTGTSEDIALDFDRRSFELRLPPVAAAAAWVALDFHPCSHCPLVSSQSPHCPFAQALSPFIAHFDQFYSYENASVEVVSERRTVIAHGALQQGMSSLIGLIGATCGCPHLAFLRPMAHFHLPFANEEETLYRAFSTHLLGRFIETGGEGGATPSLAGLQAAYQAASGVNIGMSERIRAAFSKDAVVNGLAILDTFAQAVPYVLKEKLEELRYLFEVRPGP